jgi:hypothetical protein
VIQFDRAKCDVSSRLSRISEKAKKRENVSASRISEEEAKKREVGQNGHVVLDDNLVDRFGPLCP